MKILVTGGAGFIGSHLCERLLLDGNDVIIIDNFNDYYDPSIKRDNINLINETAAKSGSRLKVIEGDIRNKAIYNDVELSDVDVVIHLAAMAGVRPSIENEDLYWDVNVNGTLNVLQMCQKNNIKKIIFASSSSVYGNNPKVPFSEFDQVDNPISPYAATKKTGELMCYTNHYLNKNSIACLRFFTVFGPRQRPDLAINKFVRLISDDKPIQLFGDGTTSRDYTYVDDIVDGILQAMNYILNKENVFEIFNLGGDEPVTLIDMVHQIESTVNKKAIVEWLPMQSGDVDRTCADITHSTNIIGYKPKTTFEEGIRNFVDWYNKLGG